MGLKKTSRTQRRPTRAAGCYGCWLLAPRRAAGRGAHGRLRQGNGAGTGAARSGWIAYAASGRVGVRGREGQRAGPVRRAAPTDQRVRPLPGYGRMTATAAGGGSKAGA